MPAWGVWERVSVLVRLDSHVALIDEKREINAEEILLIAVCSNSAFSSSDGNAEPQALSTVVREKGFTGILAKWIRQRLRSSQPFKNEDTGAGNFVKVTRQFLPSSYACDI
jgi:hypothetical protein